MQRTVTSDYIEIFLQKSTKGGFYYATTELFIAIISLCITCFALGYTVGCKSNDKAQK